jgi:hypothetical protein
MHFPPRNASLLQPLRPRGSFPAMDRKPEPVPEEHSRISNGSRFKNWLRPILLTTLCLGAMGWLLVLWNDITGTRVVAYAAMPNGVEIMVRQSFTWGGDLFNTSFHYRRPGGQWVWRYYSHEDWYWAHGRVELDEASRIATIERGGKPTIKFNWDTLAHTQFTETQDGNPRTFAPDGNE